MISITEIVLIVAGFAAIIIGYILPAGKDLDEEDKLLMEREIRELVRREVEDQKETIENMVDDTVDNSLDRTERAMERISNEKMSAIGEYSDTVINDIHKNHDEVMFMYDMLNDKHKNLTSVVTEVTKRADEAKQAVLDAEATARDARQEADAFRAAREENVRAIFLDTEEDKLSGIHIPYKEKPESGLQRLAKAQTMAMEQAPVPGPEPISAPADVPTSIPASTEPAARVARPETKPVPAAIESGYVDESNLKELKELSQIRAEVISAEKASNLHVIGNTSMEVVTPQQSKVVSINDAARIPARRDNPDKNMQELTANDPISQNRQIIEMHKAGKSNMVIARELGLGIGEVKLVIDLSNKHRKVK
ncbi:DUF6115 domain-containing protein [Butyrivibrio sp. MC2021]|uniref:DUF6115 domain-containing protein n=1 Tax=Butyrivibrio sp. MC2021 TaxID=1408306 RepID=UPI000479AE33|nr:DUF6115 domain-containing protein [Butyrivibrio sp. MC2021]